MRRREWIIAGSTLAALGGATLIYVLVYGVWLDRVRAARQETLEGSIDVHVAAIQGELDRYPASITILAHDTRIRAALDDPFADDMTLNANVPLQEIVAVTGASMAAAIHRDGHVVATSAAERGSFELPVRWIIDDPAFARALTGVLGRAESEVPGGPHYLFVRRVPGGAGVVALVVPLSRLELLWRLARQDVTVLDGRGDIILASQRSSMVARLQGAVGCESLMATRAVGQLCAVRQLKPLGWNVLLLAPDAPLREQARAAALAASLGTLVLLLIATVLLQRHLNQRQLLAVQQRSAEELQRRVDARTVELQQAQEELVQAQKLAALGQMAAGISHEINQPLAAMRGFADNALKLLDRGRPDAARDNLLTIGELCGRASRIVGDLRIFGRKSEALLVPVSVRESIGDAVRLVSSARELGASHIKAGTVLPELAVLADPVGLQQILVNLLANALDAMGTGGGVVSIEVSAGDPVVLQVIDDGPGIADDQRERIFDPFVTCKSGGQGMGLGLAISRRLAESFNGRLRAMPAARGARLVLELRRAPAAKAAR